VEGVTSLAWGRGGGVQYAVGGVFHGCAEDYADGVVGEGIYEEGTTEIVFCLGDSLYLWLRDEFRVATDRSGIQRSRCMARGRERGTREGRLGFWRGGRMEMSYYCAITLDGSG
jgi:hypothetical protein